MATPQRRMITVCQHRSCQRSGSEAVLAEFQKHQAPHLMVSGMPGPVWLRANSAGDA